MPGRRQKPDEYSARSEGQVASFHLDSLEGFLEEGEMDLVGGREGEGMSERICLSALERTRGSTEVGNQLPAAPWAPGPPCFEHSFTAGQAKSLTSDHLYPNPLPVKSCIYHGKC